MPILHYKTHPGSLQDDDGHRPNAAQHEGLHGGEAAGIPGFRSVALCGSDAGRDDCGADLLLPRWTLKKMEG